MSKDSSFDIVSKVDMQEVTNAVNQAQKEIEQRFDLKGTGSEIALEKETIALKAADEMKLKNILDIVENKLVKRNVPIKNLEYGKIESALGGAVKQVITLKQGIDKDAAKKITNMIKETKLKVQAQIQEDQIRVTGKNKDDLQAVMQKLRGADNLELDLQFINYR
ncbi:putative nucleotide-binding protein [compost metagenome]